MIFQEGVRCKFGQAHFISNVSLSFTPYHVQLILLRSWRLFSFCLSHCLCAYTTYDLMCSHPTVSSAPLQNNERHGLRRRGRRQSANMSPPRIEFTIQPSLLCYREQHPSFVCHQFARFQSMNHCEEGGDDRSPNMGMTSACWSSGNTFHSQSLSLLRFSLWPAIEDLFRACFVQALNNVALLN